MGDGVMQILSKNAVFNNYTELRDSILANNSTVLQMESIDGTEIKVNYNTVYNTKTVNNYIVYVVTSRGPKYVEYFDSGAKLSRKIDYTYTKQKAAHFNLDQAILVMSLTQRKNTKLKHIVVKLIEKLMYDITTVNIDNRVPDIDFAKVTLYNSGRTYITYRNKNNGKLTTCQKLDITYNEIEKRHIIKFGGRRRLFIASVCDNALIYEITG